MVTGRLSLGLPASVLQRSGREAFKAAGCRFESGQGHQICLRRAGRAPGTGRVAGTLEQSPDSFEDVVSVLEGRDQELLSQSLDISDKCWHDLRAGLEKGVGA
jgi:hypothetical protein